MSAYKPLLLVAAIFGGIIVLSYMKEADELEANGGDSTVGIVSTLLGGRTNLMGDGTQETDPLKLRRAEFYGWHAKHPAMATVGDGVIFATDVIADYPNFERTRNTNNRPMPARYDILQPDQSCTPRPVTDGEVLVNISVGGGTYESDLQIFDTATLAKDNVYWIERQMRNSVFEDQDRASQDHNARFVDVVLTDTSGPLYLVLQGRYAGPGLLWNVIPAPGVEIAHITMIGHNPAVNPPPGTYDIEFIPTGIKGCAPNVARRPLQTWDLYHRHMGAAGDEYKQQVQDAFAAYDAWFMGHFGQSADMNVVGFDRVSAVLWGPIPAEPIPYRPIEGSAVIVGEEDYIFAGPRDTWQPFLEAVHRDLARDAAGGDLALIFPEPISKEAVQ